MDKLLLIKEGRREEVESFLRRHKIPYAAYNAYDAVVEEEVECILDATEHKFRSKKKREEFIKNTTDIITMDDTNIIDSEYVQEIINNELNSL